MARLGLLPGALTPVVIRGETPGEDYAHPSIPTHPATAPTNSISGNMFMRLEAETVKY